MNRTEMIAFIKANPYVKITHDNFSKDEYIYSASDGYVYTEEGYLFETWVGIAHEGIRNRNGGLWEDGWELHDSEYIYVIKNTVNEWNSETKGYFSSLDKAKEALKECCDWYRSKGTGKIYRIRLNALRVAPELVYENP